MYPLLAPTSPDVPETTTGPANYPVSASGPDIRADHVIRRFSLNIWAVITRPLGNLPSLGYRGERADSNTYR
jgi:hypothetical protein